MKLQVRGHEIAGLLDRFPDGITTLSLDCFDTLIWRCVQSPRDVFASISIEGGAVESRAWAEGGSRRVRINRVGSGEVHLDDVYRRLLPNADDAQIADAVAHELACEAQHCFAFAPTVALMRAAKARGLSIVIVSDMYLSEAQLRDLITAAAGEDVLAMVDRVYMSSDHERSKSDGLLAHMMTEMGVRPDQVAHVGDNPKADFESAVALGIHAVHFLQFDPSADDRLRMEGVAAGMIDPAVRITRPAYQFHRTEISTRGNDDPVYALGHDVIGPALHGFALWLKAEIDALSATLGKPVRPLFMMRDGYLPFRVFDALFPEVEARTVEISRFVATRACLHNQAMLEDYIYEWLDRISLSTLARQLSLFGPEAQRWTKGESTEKSRAAFAKFALSGDNPRKILKRSAGFAEKLCGHLRAADVGDGDAIMLVDIGYNGTVQNVLTPMLSERMGLTVVGRYMFLREEQLSGLDKKGLLDVRTHECRTLHALATCVAVVEQLCNISQGSTIDYDAKGAPIREELAANHAQSETRDTVQRAALDFLARSGEAVHRAPVLDTVAARRESAAAILARLLFLPSEEEVRIFETFDQDVNMGTNMSVKLLDQDAATEGLRRHGLSYVNDVVRMYVPAEVRRHGLPLNLSLSILRNSLDLRSTDFDCGGVKIPVILADATDQSLVELEAKPTVDGYYSMLIPVGRGRFTAAIALGASCEHFQIDDACFYTIEDLEASRRNRGIAGVRMTDAMTELAPDLFASTPNGVVIIAPPASAKDNMVLSFVFRPVRWRDTAQQQRQAA